MESSSSIRVCVKCAASGGHFSLEGGSGANKLLGVKEGFRRQALPAQHAANFLGSLGPVEFDDGGDGSAFGLLLFDTIVEVGEGGNLGLVGDAEDLVAAAEFFQAAADGLRGFAADSGVHFIKHQ